MTHSYSVNGMTCNGCRTHVEEVLNNVNGVKKAVVDLEKEEAVIEMKQHIEVSKFQAALPEKYKISKIPDEQNVFQSAATENSIVKDEKSKLQQLKPLLIILGYITVATVLLNYNRDSWNGAMLDFMGLFFITFSFFKILDLRGFSISFRMYDPLAQVVPVYSWIYPFIETVLGLLFLMRLEVPIALIVTLIILGITTVGVAKTLLNKKSIQCACLGTALKLPMTEATIIENAIMIVMAMILLIGFL